jgi:hypothetical protein
MMFLQFSDRLATEICMHGRQQQEVQQQQKRQLYMPTVALTSMCLHQQ